MSLNKLGAQERQYYANILLGNTFKQFNIRGHVGVFTVYIKSIQLDPEGLLIINGNTRIIKNGKYAAGKSVVYAINIDAIHQVIDKLPSTLELISYDMFLGDYNRMNNPTSMIFSTIKCIH